MEWYIFAFLSAIFGAMYTIITKKILVSEHVQEFNAQKGIIIITLLLFLTPFINLALPWYVYIIIWFASLLITAGTIFYLKSLRHGEISTITPLMNLSPLFLFIFAFLFLQEIPTTKQYIGAFILITGAYILEIGINKKGLFEPLKIFFNSKRNIFLLFAMVILSITATMDKLILSNYTDYLTYLVILLIFESINFIIIQKIKYGFNEIKKDFKKDGKKTFLAAILHILTILFFYIALSLPGALVSLAIPIKRTSNLFATIIGGKLFHEKNLHIKTIACIIMITGVILII